MLSESRSDASRVHRTIAVLGHRRDNAGDVQTCTKKVSGNVYAGVDEAVPKRCSDSDGLLASNCRNPVHLWPFVDLRLVYGNVNMAVRWPISNPQSISHGSSQIQQSGKIPKAWPICKALLSARRERRPRTMSQPSRQLKSATSCTKFRYCDAGASRCSPMKRHVEVVVYAPGFMNCALCSGSRLRQVGHTVLPTDLTAVIDARSRAPACQGSKAELLQLRSLAGSNVSPVLDGLINHEAGGPFSLRSHPGCIIFPGWLTQKAQMQIASDSFTIFPDAPAKTNHSARFGDLRGLWEAARAEKVLQKSSDASDTRDSGEWEWVSTCEHHLNKKGEPRPGVVTARRLWEGLRWATLGPPYGAPPTVALSPGLNA